MRILVLSDIHANLTALAAALAEAKNRWDCAVCLGDIVGYGPDPNEAVSAIRELGARTIRGNHDKAVCGLVDTSDFNPAARFAVDWTRSQLSDENLSYLRDLPQGPMETEGLVLVHGAIFDEDEYIFTPAQALESLLDSAGPVTFFGHTHHQGGFSYQNTSMEVISIQLREGETSTALKLDAQRRYLLNPGSIGQPRDSDPRAGFAITDLAAATVEFWRVPYDIAGVQERMRAAGLPPALANRLSYGR